MATDRPGLVLGVLTADCLPVVLAVPESGAVAIAHAGWRGTLEGVVPAAVRELCAIAGARPGNVVAALGPAIGGCCYSVGDEVREAFRGRWGAAQTRGIFTRAGGWRLDLQAANLRQLREAGVPARAVTAVPLCTSCRKELFFSYRRDGRRSGRMLNFVTPPRPSRGRGSSPRGLATIPRATGDHLIRPPDWAPRAPGRLSTCV